MLLFSVTALSIVEKTLGTIQYNLHFSSERTESHVGVLQFTDWFDKELERRSQSLALCLTDPVSFLLFLLFMRLLESMRQY